jgi:hypothetical protein
VKLTGGACKSMNHAQKYLAQANRHIAELAVQIAHQRAIVKNVRLTQARAPRWRSRCLMRSKQAFAFSRSTGYFCSVCSGSLAPCRRERPRWAGACHEATGMDEPITPAASSWQRLPWRPLGSQHTRAFPGCDPCGDRTPKSCVRPWVGLAVAVARNVTRHVQTS